MEYDTNKPRFFYYTCIYSMSFPSQHRVACLVLALIYFDTRTNIPLPMLFPLLFAEGRDLCCLRRLWYMIGYGTWYMLS